MQARKRSGTLSAASSTSKPPEPVTFFLDESLDSLAVVTALREAGAAVERLTEHFPKGTPDEVWLTEAGRKARLPDHSIGFIQPLGCSVHNSTD